MLSIAVTMESLVNVAAVVVTRNQSYNETIEQPLGRSMSIKSENDGRRQLFHIAWLTIHNKTTKKPQSLKINQWNQSLKEKKQ